MDDRRSLYDGGERIIASWKLKASPPWWRKSVHKWCNALGELLDISVFHSISGAALNRSSVSSLAPACESTSTTLIFGAFETGGKAGFNTGPFLSFTLPGPLLKDGANGDYSLPHHQDHNLFRIF